MKAKPFILFLAMSWTASAAAQDKIENAEEKAESALREGMPRAAVAPLKEALAKSSGEQKQKLTLLLARSLLAAGRPQEALKTLNDVGSGGTEAQLLRAAALAAEGSLTDAAALAGPLAARNTDAALLLARIRMEEGDAAAARKLMPAPGAALPEDPNSLRLLLELQLATGQPEETDQLIESVRAAALLPAPEIDMITGRLRLLQGRTAEAADAFHRTLGGGNAPAFVQDNARLGLARALRALGKDTEARGMLREALSANSVALGLRPIMEEWIAAEKAAGADPNGELRAWSSEKNPRGTEGGLQLARSELDVRGTEATIALLQDILGRENLPPAESERTRLMLAEAKVAVGQPAESLQVLESLGEDGSLSYQLAMLRGRALAASGSFRRAHESFTSALARAKTKDERTAASANCLLTALAAGDLDLARKAHKDLRERAADDPGLLGWSFLLAAAEAREGNTDGLNALSKITPANEYTFQAKLALAEWRLARGEGPAAERILKTAEPEAEILPRSAALAAAEIFAADNAGSRTRKDLSAACETFLAENADAPETTDVAFKLAELHSRGGDHAAAESVLARLAEKLTDPEQSALALFLAAQAASRSMSEAGADRAMSWFDDVAKGKSELRQRARLEQASLLLRATRFKDALAIYESILSSEAPAEVHHAARMEKGDILFAMAAEQPEKFAAAAAVYATIAKDASAPPDWRDQAACKRAASLARSGQTDGALAAYREVLSRTPAQGTDPYWFFKAGLEAGRILENQEDWPAAVAIYDRMASVNNPQSEELTQRARRLRLEHFIWEN